MTGGAIALDGDVIFEPAPDADASKTILGHLMIRLTDELGLSPGEITFAVLPFGMLRLELAVSGSSVGSS